MYVTTFAVKGSGHFPLDMLRYDRCCPDGQDDVDKIASCHHGEDYFQERLVRLIAYHSTKNDPHITTSRWLSFGWSVVQPTITRKI